MEETGVETHLTSSVSLAGHWTTLLRTKKLAFQEIEKRVLVPRNELERFAAITTIRVGAQPCCLRKLEQDISPVGTDVLMHFKVPGFETRGAYI